AERRRRGRRPPHRGQRPQHLLRRLPGRRGRLDGDRSPLDHSADRAVGLRQVDVPPVAQPHARGHRRRLRPGARHVERRRPLRARCRPRRGAPQGRHGVPAAEPVPDHVDLRQRHRRHEAELEAAPQGRDRRGRRTVAARRQPLGRGQGPPRQARFGSVRWPAAAPLHRPSNGRRARRVADGRAVFGARPDLDARDRAADARTAGAFHDRDRDPQHAAGRPRQRAHRLLQHRGHRQAGTTRRDRRHVEDLLEPEPAGHAGLRTRRPPQPDRTPRRDRGRTDPAGHRHPPRTRSGGRRVRAPRRCGDRCPLHRRRRARAHDVGTPGAGGGRPPPGRVDPQARARNRAFGRPVLQHLQGRSPDLRPRARSEAAWRDPPHGRSGDLGVQGSHRGVRRERPGSSRRAARHGRLSRRPPPPVHRPDLREPRDRHRRPPGRRPARRRRSLLRAPRRPRRQHQPSRALHHHR
ncbi:unnamed protein product, partial [Symbiodinium sp. KB8]